MVRTGMRGDTLDLDLDQYRGRQLNKRGPGGFSYLREQAEKAGVYVLLIGNLGSHHTSLDSSSLALRCSRGSDRRSSPFNSSRSNTTSRSNRPDAADRTARARSLGSTRLPRRR